MAYISQRVRESLYKFYGNGCTLVGGIVLLVISVPIAGILHVGISRGKKNVEKIIKAIEKNSSKNA
jgi:hypothetical protein